ncbi:MAG: M48 family metalloprotease [Halioglobus sp.]
MHLKSPAPRPSHQHPHRLARMALFASALALTGCATSVVSPEQETKAGTAMSQQVNDQIGLYIDPELERYVDSVGQRLVTGLGESPYKFQFAIVDQFEPNAFASPGGFIYVSRGLLAQMNDEAELAGVLAHEISHVTQRHHVRQAGRSVGAGLFTLPGRAVGIVSKDLGNMINSPIEHAGQVYLSSFSRGQESEADAYGMRLANTTGYDALALADALDGIEKSLYLLTGEQHEANYLDTHPTTPQRVADINKLAAELVLQPIPPLANREQLFEHLDGLWWGPQNPQQGMFQDNLFLSADLGLSVTFPEDWETVNTPRFVGAMEPEGKAYLALGVNSGEFGPEGYAAALITRMRDGSGLQPNVSRSFQIGDWPAHVVRYDDSSDTETVSLYYVFLNTGDSSFTFMAMGFEHLRETLRSSVMSIAKLTAAQEKSIVELRLRVADIAPGESLDNWAERVNSKWSVEFIAAMNGIDDKSAKGKGERLKYAREERYVAP